MFSFYVLGMGLILCFSLVWGIFLLSRRRWISGSIAVGLPVFIVGAVVGLYFWAFYESKPSALDLSLEQEGQQFIVKGKWNTRLEPYQFGTDFLVFYTPEDIPVQPLRYTKGEWQPDYWNFQEDIVEHVRETAPMDRKAQLFDVKAEEEFKFVFEVPGNISLGQLKIYYVHVHSAPMSSFTYWAKEVR
ncbi:hypothetical protein [Ammoniphilus sp. CFH 90114]|uniref:hypothetical protein n=1 Tax=Ammoniphilus sp. CFH 90114 TaxID=2493665 RepID=UPI00100DCE6E|nr:hypothetical protein [Ammoniphilus sp. CFH 90114]RXT07185.1 hypothetical protein EIZ39_13660 [Ammoniphilus sp. CFH 90114]